MPNLSIKNVPDEVVKRLRARARANHRSLQGELLDLACRAAAGPGTERLRHEPTDHGSGGQKSIEEIAAEHRERRAQPVAEAPRSVDVIRRDRDAR